MLVDGVGAAVNDARVAQDGAAEIAVAGETPTVDGPAVGEVAPAEVSTPVEATPAGVYVAASQEPSAEVVASPALDATSAPSNLKAATANSRRKSLRKMPLIVLVALAMLLASSIAFAAYLVVKNVVIPAMQQQEQPAQESQVDNSPTPNEQAHEAYEVVLQQWRDAVAAGTASSDSSLYGLSGGVATDSTTVGFDENAHYPYVSSRLAEILVASGDSYVLGFIYEDLDNDGIDELVVGYNDSEVLAAYTYVGGEIEVLCSAGSGIRASLWLTESGELAALVSSGNYVYDVTAYSVEGAILTQVESLSVDIPYGVSRGIEVTWQEDDSTLITSTYTQSEYDADNPLNEFQERYPSVQDGAWQAL